MPLRVGFDLDGTVADMYSALRREAVTLFGEEVLHAPVQASHPQEAGKEQSPQPKPEDDQTATLAIQELRLTARQQNQLWDHVKNIENFWTSLPELEPGIISRIAQAAAQRRWEVIFLTTRPSTKGELVQLQSQRWLEAHGFQYPSVYVVQRSRGKIADALGLDVFVDDRPENCLDIAVESKAKVILVWHGSVNEVPAGARRLGVRPVTTITEGLALLEQLDDIRNLPSLMRSFKKAIGAASD
jgi:FMN phosphatase YigB (HAD superfamily)